MDRQDPDLPDELDLPEGVSPEDSAPHAKRKGDPAMLAAIGAVISSGCFPPLAQIVALVRVVFTFCLFAAIIEYWSHSLRRFALLRLMRLRIANRFSSSAQASAAVS